MIVASHCRAVIVLRFRQLQLCSRGITTVERGISLLFAAVKPYLIVCENSKGTFRGEVMNRESLDRYSRRTLTEFLSTSSQAGYAPASGEIVGILKQLLEVPSAYLLPREVRSQLIPTGGRGATAE